MLNIKLDPKQFIIEVMEELTFGMGLDHTLNL